MVDYIFTSPLLSHIHLQLSKEISDMLNYKCAIIFTALLHRLRKKVR